jgi:hypothetical protein
MTHDPPARVHGTRWLALWMVVAVVVGALIASGDPAVIPAALLIGLLLIGLHSAMRRVVQVGVYAVATERSPWGLAHFAVALLPVVGGILYLSIKARSNSGGGSF